VILYLQNFSSDGYIIIDFSFVHTLITPLAQWLALQHNEGLVGGSSPRSAIPLCFCTGPPSCHCARELNFVYHFVLLTDSNDSTCAWPGQLMS
jgi:hypothetical protein